LTDVTQTWLDMRNALQGKVCVMFLPTLSEVGYLADYDKTGTQYGRTFLWTSLLYYTPFQYTRQFLIHKYLTKIGGPFEKEAVVSVAA